MPRLEPVPVLSTSNSLTKNFWVATLEDRLVVRVGDDSDGAVHRRTQARLWGVIVKSGRL